MMDYVQETIDKTDEYLRIPSVVGHEKPFLDFLFEEYQQKGFHSTRSDNIVAVSGKNPTDAYLSIHIDRHGIVSLGKGDYLYAAHAIRNYKYNEDLSNKLSHLKQIRKNFDGESVYAYGRWSGDLIAKGVVQSCDYCEVRGNLIFKIKGMKDLPEGVPISYQHGAIEQDGYVTGQIDNTLSVGLVHALYSAGYQGTTFFTAEEEIGKSWKHLSTFLAKEHIKTDQLIILDSSPYDDTKPADEGKVILRNRDSLAEFNPALTQTLKQACKDLNLSYDVKDEELMAAGKKETQVGRTELGRLISETENRWNGTTIQIPSFNYHTNNESTTRLAIQNVFCLLKKVLIDDKK